MVQKQTPKIQKPKANHNVIITNNKNVKPSKIIKPGAVIKTTVRTLRKVASTTNLIKPGSPSPLPKIVKPGQPRQLPKKSSFGMSQTALQTASAIAGN